MDLPKFLRLQQLRSHNIMWFLGAGASASSGVPTADHLTWEFKRVIYCTEQRVSRRACSDLSDPALRARIQHYFDSQGTYPPQDSP
ncbi:MAG: SIR2 family protein, partial [Gammaproteobacteria bacterium]|nr:SIR2 family protein [Gammaproteobacteria bacterium]